MSDTNDYTAKIRAKGLDSTGITEQVAAEMYRNKGRRYMAIVELVVDETHEKADGTRKVDLVLSLVEPAVDDHMGDHLRELTRVTYRNRQQADGQLAIDDQLRDEPTVAQVLDDGQRFRPHPFLPDDAAKDTPICDVCGAIEASAVHSRQDTLPDPDDDVELIEPEDDVDKEDEPHEYEPGPDDSCLHCGRAEHEDFATADPEFDDAIAEPEEHLAAVEDLEQDNPFGNVLTIPTQAAANVPNPFDPTPAGA